LRAAKGRQRPYLMAEMQKRESQVGGTYNAIPQKAASKITLYGGG